MLFQSIQQRTQQLAQMIGDRMAMENGQRLFILGLLCDESLTAFAEKCLTDWRVLGGCPTPDQSQPHSNEFYEIQPELFGFEPLRFINHHHNSTGGQLRQAF